MADSAPLQARNPKIGCGSMNAQTANAKRRGWALVAAVLLGAAAGCASWQQPPEWSEAVSNAQHLLDPAQGPVTTQGREIEEHLRR